VRHYGERSASTRDRVFPESDGHLTECTVKTIVSRALNLEFDWETFSNTKYITSADNWSFRLKLIPIGLSFWFTSFWIVIPTISLSSTSRNTCLNRSFTLARKCATESLLSEGGIKRTVSAFLQHCTACTLSYSCPVCRICEQCSISLSLQRIHTYLGSTHPNKTHLPHLYSDYLQFCLWGPHTLLLQCMSDHIYCWWMLTSFSCLFQSYGLHAQHLPRHATYILEVVIVLR